jgi:manganese-dependent inorganic pyrophosphatase
MSNIYVIGHKSPDLDSIAAAIAYANLKNKTENTDIYEPRAAGEINKETEFALKKFNISKPEVLKSASKESLVLVDHNETSQIVDGISEGKILEVVDHHKIDFKSSEPILFAAKPWGASCTIIAQKYFNAGIELEKDLAGLMLSAILIDTVITKSPTCTEKDKEIILKLAKISGVDNWQEYGLDLFKVRSRVCEMSNTEIIKSDFKDFDFKTGKFGIGQVETVDLGEFAGREDGLISELNKIKNENGYHSVILFLTDIIKEGSLFLVATVDEVKVEKALGEKLENNKVFIPGILSRKKQVAPKFTEVFDI